MFLHKGPFDSVNLWVGGGEVRGVMVVDIKLVGNGVGGGMLERVPGDLPHLTLWTMPLYCHLEPSFSEKMQTHKMIKKNANSI